MTPLPAVREPREVVALKANPDLTDDEHHWALSIHEAAHMVTAIALGFSPVRVWMNLDRTKLDQQGHTDVAGTSTAQYSITWVSAGAVAEERAVRELGYDETTHPEFFRNCYTFNAYEDNAMVQDMHLAWHGHPQMFDSKERALQDAKLLVYDDHLWEATKALASVLRLNHGPDRGLDAQRVREVLAPYRVESAVQERELKIWAPDKFEENPDLWAPDELEDNSHFWAPDEPEDTPDLRALADNPDLWSLAEGEAGNITRLDAPRGLPHVSKGKSTTPRTVPKAAAVAQALRVTRDSRLAPSNQAASGQQADTPTPRRRPQGEGGANPHQRRGLSR